MMKQLVKISILSALFFFASTSQANVVGADTQNFNPITSGVDFVTVHSSETLQPGVINAGLFFNYAINSLANIEDVSTQSRDEIIDSLVSMDFNLGVGLLKNWEVGVSFPQVLSQDVDNPAFRAQFAETGSTEVRANTKFRFWGDRDGGGAVILSMNYPLIDNNPFTGEEPGPTFNFQFALDGTIERVAIGANVGYRLRNSGERVTGFNNIEPFQDQLIGSLAASYYITEIDTKIIAELFGAIPTQETEFESDRDLSSLELLVGLKYDVLSNLALHVGAGTEIYQGAASPDWRVYGGINYNIGPLFGIEEDTELVESIEITQMNAGIPPEESTEYKVIDAEGSIFDQEPTALVENFVARDILFEFDKDVVKREFFPALAKLANYLLKGDGFKKLIITGHTDSIGSDAYNQGLSERRAKSVKRLLYSVLKTKRPDIKRKQIQAVGKGERFPIADNGNYQGRQLNRRVEFRIYR